MDTSELYVSILDVFILLHVSSEYYKCFCLLESINTSLQLPVIQTQLTQSLIFRCTSFYEVFRNPSFKDSWFFYHGLLGQMKTVLGNDKNEQIKKQ